MAKKTEKNFIEALAENLEPVTPIPSSKRQTFIWVLCALAVIGLMVYYHGLRFDIQEKFHEIGFIIESGVFIILALIIAFAGFKLGVPNAEKSQRMWGALVYGGLIFWVVMFVYSLYQGFITGAHHSHFHAGKFCSATIIASALTSAGVMFYMMRQSFALSPILTGLAIGITSSTIAYLGGMYFCSIEGGMHIALWHMLPVLIVSLLISVLGQFILKK